MFTDKKRWMELRDAYLKAARDNMAVLYNPNSYWRMDRNDPQLIEANRRWVEKAKRCHRIAMGRISPMEVTVVSHGKVLGPKTVFAS